jgi:hypothetical protein
MQGPRFLSDRTTMKFVLEEFVLEWHQARWNSTSLKVYFCQPKKVGDSGPKFGGDGSRVRLPVGTDEELFGVKNIRGASKHHLGVDVAAKTFDNFCKVLETSCIGWFRAKVQTEPKQRVKMWGRLQAGTKIVAGKVARAREE